MKITIVSKRDFAIPDQNDPQKIIRGIMYGCFTDKGGAFEFSSQNQNHEVHMTAEYDPMLAVEVPIKAKFFGGKVKYAEVPFA